MRHSAQARPGPHRIRDPAAAAPLLADRHCIARLEAQGKVRSRGTLAHCWLGVPLFRDEAVVGVIAVQSYSPAICFTARDQELLTFVAHHIGIGLARKQAQDRLLAAHAELEQRVDLAHARAGRDQCRAAGADRRAPARRTAAHPPGPARRADRPAEPRAVAGPPGGAIARAQADGRQGAAVRGAVPRPGPLQAGQRQRRPCRRRRTADRSRPPHRRGGARRTTRWRGWAATSSRSWSRTSTTCMRPRNWPERILVALGEPCWIAGREVFPSASIGIAAVASALPHAARKCCATPTPRCTAPRPPAATAARCSTRPCARKRCASSTSKPTCAARSTATASSRTTSRSCASTTGSVHRPRGVAALAPRAARPARAGRVHRRWARTAA